MEKKKMLFSTTTYAYLKDGDFKGAVKLIKDGGFDAYDFNLTVLSKDENCVLNTDRYTMAARELREYADGIGIVCNQSHAPYPSSFTDERETAEMYKRIIRAMEITSIVGGKHIIIHPKQHLPYAENREKLKEQNYKFYMSLVPYCEEYGVKVALENMFQRDSDDPVNTNIIPSTCSDPAEFCEYLDALPREHFVACLDIGHTVITGQDPANAIRVLGHDRLKALHVHDNWLRTDDHSVPLLGRIPYDTVMQALRDIDYDGDITLESIAFESRFPFGLKPAVLEFLNRVGRYLMNNV